MWTWTNVKSLLYKNETKLIIIIKKEFWNLIILFSIDIFVSDLCPVSLNETSIFSKIFGNNLSYDNEWHTVNQ